MRNLVLMHNGKPMMTSVTPGPIKARILEWPDDDADLWTVHEVPVDYSHLQPADITEQFALTWALEYRFGDGIERAGRALELAGLQRRRDDLAGAASHGEQRQLEIAMTLATEPQVLLLDEPLAGMGTAEAESMVALLLRLKKDHAMMLVEHDMDAVFALADHLTVMVNGQVIAGGAPAQVRADPNVQSAYLGEEAAHE